MLSSLSLSLSSWGTPRGFQPRGGSQLEGGPDPEALGVTWSREVLCWVSVFFFQKPSLLKSCPQIIFPGRRLGPQTNRHTKMIIAIAESHFCGSLLWQGATNKHKNGVHIVSSTFPVRRSVLGSTNTKHHSRSYLHGESLSGAFNDVHGQAVDFQPKQRQVRSFGALAQNLSSSGVDQRVESIHKWNWSGFHSALKLPFCAQVVELQENHQKQTRSGPCHHNASFSWHFLSSSSTHGEFFQENHWQRGSLGWGRTSMGPFWCCLDSCVRIFRLDKCFPYMCKRKIRTQVLELLPAPCFSRLHPQHFTEWKVVFCSGYSCLFFSATTIKWTVSTPTWIPWMCNSSCTAWPQFRMCWTTLRFSKGSRTLENWTLSGRQTWAKRGDYRPALCREWSVVHLVLWMV